ncbi:MAG TPA: hypothetical protein VGD64_09945 [Acidisarcina sp.]
MRVIRAILNFFYEILLGCRHEKLTRPFTLEQQTYKVCLDCGRQVFYSAESMRPLSAGEVRRMKLAQSHDNVVPLTSRRRTEAGSRSKPSVAA